MRSARAETSRAGGAAGVLVVLGLVAACSSRLAPPDLGPIYDAIAQAEEGDRDPVILIPGILGSKLSERGTGRLVWGAFGGGSASPSDPEGARLLALPIDSPRPVHELADQVYASGVLDSLHVSLLGLPIDVAAYAHILLALGVGGYRDEELGLAGAVDYGTEHYTCFQFPYDWRRDLAANARALGEFIEEKAAYVRDERLRRTGDSGGPVRFDLVAHSMGGLVARYYLRYGGRDLPPDGSPPELDWAGAARLDQVVLIGTPNAGSTRALQQLTEGASFGPFLPHYPAALIGTMPSVYQLLPRARHGALVEAGEPGRRIDDLFDAALWERMGWGLLDPDQGRVLGRLLPGVPDAGERRRLARRFVDRCLRRAEAIHRALDRPPDAAAPRPPGVRLHLVAGDAVGTPSVLGARPDGSLVELEYGPGDATVLRSSALLDERVGGTWQPRLRTPIPWSGVMFFFEEHLGLTQDEAFIDNLLFLLLEEPL